MTNRILWNQRPTDGRGVDAVGDIDEIVLHDIRTLHIEQMAGRCWWIGIYLYGDRDPYWMGNFVADSRGRMRFTQQENNGIVWEIDQTHEVPAGSCSTCHTRVVWIPDEAIWVCGCTEIRPDNDERPSPGEGRGARGVRAAGERR